jgi:hypothetical protein
MQLFFASCLIDLSFCQNYAHDSIRIESQDICECDFVGQGSVWGEIAMGQLTPSLSNQWVTITSNSRWKSHNTTLNCFSAEKLNKDLATK